MTATHLRVAAVALVLASLLALCLALTGFALAVLGVLPLLLPAGGAP